MNRCHRKKVALIDGIDYQKQKTGGKVMVYIVYYTCPNCKHPNCGESPSWEANEMIEAASKNNARQWFNSLKPCRHMKITRIVEYKNETTTTISKVDRRK